MRSALGILWFKKSYNWTKYAEVTISSMHQSVPMALLAEACKAKPLNPSSVWESPIAVRQVLSTNKSMGRFFSLF